MPTSYHQITNLLTLTFISFVMMPIGLVLTEEHGTLSPRKTTNNPLQGKHMRILANLLISENSVRVNKVTGILEELTGGTGEFLFYLSRRYNFTYSIVQGIKATTFYATGGNGSKGLIDYVIEEKGDILVGPILLTSSRYAVGDVTPPWIFATMYLLNANPIEKANIASVVQPFQWPVWMLLIFSIIIAMGLSKMMGRFLKSPVFSKLHQPVESTQHLNLKVKRLNKPVLPYLYIFGMILSQGGQCPSKNVRVRLIAGSWCLAAAVLCYSYNSVLITYVLAPIRAPIINSVYDIVRDNDAKLVVEKGRGYDDLISTSKEKNGIFKQLRDKLDSYSKSRCSPRSECVNLVKSGAKITFGTAYEYLANIVDTEFRRTGKCMTLVGQQGFMPSPIGWMLPKNSPYTTTLSKGVLEILDTGIYSYWKTQRGISKVVPRECQILAQNSGANVKAGINSQLSIKDLTGAFVILAIGYAISTVVFISEKIAFLNQTIIGRPSGNRIRERPSFVTMWN